MAPVTQDIVLFIKPSENLSLISCKGGKMALNRFCIDEEMANKCTGAFYLSETKWTFGETKFPWTSDKPKIWQVSREVDHLGKGKMNLIQVQFEINFPH